MRFAGRLDPEQFWELIDRGQQRVRDAADLLPLYGLSGWTGEIMTGSWEWENGQLVKAGLVHGRADRTGPRLQVLTTSREPLAIVDYDADGLTGPDDLELPVDGDRVPFALWRGSERWVAIGGLATHGLVLKGVDIDPTSVVLVPVHDLEPYLAGRRSALRTRRGEA
jgi:hypothetical protein